MALPYQGRSVFTRTTNSGFKQQVFVMYHSTSPVGANNILKTNFAPSNERDNMLGQGIYVAKDVKKSLPYGPVTFKLLVYTGRVKAIEYQGHPLQKDWQRYYNSAWVPPHCGMVPSGLQENCIKTHRQIMILGVVRGFQLLDHQARNLTCDLTYQ